MIATLLHVTSGLGLRKFQADGFLLTRVYKHIVQDVNCKSQFFRLYKSCLKFFFLNFTNI